jgi:hypothetical protein
MNYNVYAIVKSFCLCQDHFFFNEEILKRDLKQVEMKDILVNKNELGKAK